MKSEDIQRQIESMQRSLRKASANLGPDDSGVSELKRIMQRKMDEASRAVEEESTAAGRCILFADDEDEVVQYGSSTARRTVVYR